MPHIKDVGTIVEENVKKETKLAKRIAKNQNSLRNEAKHPNKKYQAN